MEISDQYWTCSLCEKQYDSLTASGGTCEESGCEEPICGNCWSMRGRRFCWIHSSLPIAQLEATGPPEKANKTGDTGGNRVTTHQAKSIEISFSGRFDINVQRILSLNKTQKQRGSFKQIRHNSADKLNELRRLPECKYSVSHLRNKFPLNASSSYILRARNSKLFNSKQDIVLEGRYFARMDKYLIQGYDDQTIILDELTSLVASLTSKEATQATKEYRIVGLFSPTGWDRASIDYVCGNEDVLPFAHRSISVSLIGPDINELHFNSLDDKLVTLIMCFEGTTLVEEVNQCKSQLSDRLLIYNYVAIDGFIKREGFDSQLAQLACGELLQEDENIEFVKVKTLGKVLRMKEDKK